MANNVAGDPDVIFLPGLAASSLSYKGLQHLQVPRADGTTFAHKKEGAAFSCALLFIREKNILQKVPGDFPSISMVRIGSHAFPLVARMVGMQGSHTLRLFIEKWALPAKKGMNACRKALATPALYLPPPSLPHFPRHPPGSR